MPFVRPHARRLVRLAPAALAAYELHSLFGAVSHAGAALHWLAGVSPGSVAPWLLLALALGAGVLLRESARGLVALLALGAVLGGALGEHLHLLAEGFGPLGWLVGLPAAVLAGVVLGDLVGAARWALHALARVRTRPPAPAAPDRAALVRRRARDSSLPPAPLLAGWSGRGPPHAALAAA